MKHIYCIFFIFYFSFLQAQNYGKRNNTQQLNLYGKITGIVKELDSDLILPYANIALLKVSSESNRPEIINSVSKFCSSS